MGITGASGIVYGLRLLEVLSRIEDIETHVVVSERALEVSEFECFPREKFLDYVRKFSDRVYSNSDLSAPISSSSFLLDAGTIIPCTIKTAASIAYGIADSLIARVSLNLLRMRRPLVLVIRETPLGAIELGILLKLARAGAVIMPASPAFYYNPKSIRDIVDFIVGKVLDALGIRNELYTRWSGTKSRCQTVCDHIF